MSQTATGTLTILDHEITFVGSDTDGRPISCKGALIPTVPAPGVAFNAATFTYDNLDDLPGKHDFISGHVGTKDAVVVFKSRFGEPHQLTFKGECTQNERTDLKGGLIRF